MYFYILIKICCFQPQFEMDSSYQIDFDTHNMYFQFWTFIEWWTIFLLTKIVSHLETKGAANIRTVTIYIAVFISKGEKLAFLKQI